MSTRLRWTVTAALLAATLGSSPVTLAAPPAPAPSQQAHQHFRSGVQLFEEGDHAAALVEFQRAYDIDPRFQVLYNIAQSHYQLQDYASALQTYQRYLDEGGAKIPFKRRKDVEAEIVTLSGRVATLTITTSEPGAAVTIDDRKVGTTPLEPLLVSSGRRKITATLPGRAPATSVVDLAGGDKKAVELEIPALPAPLVITERSDPTTPAPVERPSPLPAVVMWSVTGALATGAVITGVVALGASSDVEDELARFPGDPEALASASSSASGFGLATDILIGASVVSAAVATYFTVDLALGPDDEATPEPAAARVVVMPRGIAVDGTF